MRLCADQGTHGHEVHANALDQSALLELTEVLQRAFWIDDLDTTAFSIIAGGPRGPSLAGVGWTSRHVAAQREAGAERGQDQDVAGEQESAAPGGQEGEVRGGAAGECGAGWSG